MSQYKHNKTATPNTASNSTNHKNHLKSQTRSIENIRSHNSHDSKFAATHNSKNLPASPRITASNDNHTQKRKKKKNRFPNIKHQLHKLQSTIAHKREE